MSELQNMIKGMYDAELTAFIRSADALDQPLSRRFAGDDDLICDLMNVHRLPQTLAKKLMVKGLLLREAVHRGLQIPQSN